EQVLSITPDLGPDLQKEYEEKILVLKKEIEDIDQMDSTISSEDVAVFKDTWSPEENAHVVLGSTSAYKELGLHNEAIEEYMKLLKLDYPTVNLLPGLVESLFTVHSPSRVIDKIEKIISENTIHAGA
ncbi:MAG: hypothetical protein JRI75_13050, partial [Deltaproteobacteria bacterium]|nr:hypothetical protein [Deltaproteobacteria bacterium]